MLVDTLEFSCAFCGEPNEVDLDPSAGRRQSFTEDCQICCHPNSVAVELDVDGYPSVWTMPES
ncbi:MAG: CPXCG motif-containing cysteine-rich protein [Acidobacteriota bacterium]